MTRLCAPPGHHAEGPQQTRQPQLLSHCDRDDDEDDRGRCHTYKWHELAASVKMRQNECVCSCLKRQRLLSDVKCLLLTDETCEGGERKPARVFSVKPARKMISNIDYPIISHLSNMPTFFWAKTRQIRGADTPRGRNVPGKEAGQRQTKWHTVWCAISICHTWPRR